jgi:hypothetical protein
MKKIRRPEGEGCPACSHRMAYETQHPTLFRCAACDAIYGQCTLGDSYAFVSPFMVESEPPIDEIRYFDFQCLASQGRVVRRHGWYHPASGRIVQIG